MESSSSMLEIESQLKILQDQGNYQSIIILGEKSLAKKANYSDEILQFVCNSYEKSQYWDRLIQTQEKYWDQIQSDQIKYEMLNQKAEAYIQLNRYELGLQAVEQIKKLCKKNGRKEELQQAHEKEQIIKNEQGKTFRSIEKRKEEAKAVIQLFQYSEEQGFYNIQGMPLYVIPQKWFDQWKKYTFFEQVLQNNEELPDDDENEISPGKIDTSSLLLLSDEQLRDPDPIKKSTNLVIDPKFRRNIDYYVLSQPLHRHFKELYGGEGIRRLVIWQDEENENSSMEIFLKKINLCIVDEMQISNQDWTLRNVHICCKETGTDLREKIIRCLKSMYPERQTYLESKGESQRLWKIQSREDLELLKKNLLEDYQKNRMTKIDVEEIINTKSIEDQQIADEDILIMEIYSKRMLIGSRTKDFCANCGTTQNLQFCSCLKIKYCCKNCQNDHRAYHKELCQEQTKNNELKQKLHQKFNITKPLSLDQMKSGGLNGLQNLGNTCFMNSSIQCLSNVRELTQYLISNRYVDDINHSNPLGTRGELASSYAELLKEIWGPNPKAVSAWSLKKIVQHIAPQFSGYQQQDSQELLSYIVDGIHEDLNRVVKKEVVENLDFDGKNDQEDSLKAWDNYLKRNRSVIQELMVGQYKSTIVCPDCQKVSVTYDPYQIISVPVQKEVREIELSFYLVKRDHNASPGKWEISIKRNKRVSDLYKLIAKKCNVNRNNLRTMIVHQHKKIKEIENDQSVSIFEKESNHLIFVQELFSEEEDGEDFDRTEGIQFDVNLQTIDDRGSASQFTYPRLLNIRKDLNFQELHLRIYLIIRPYIIKFYEQNTQLISKYQLKLFEEETPENLIEEFESLKRADLCPVSKVFLVLDNKLQELKPDVNSSMSKLFRMDKKIIYNLDLNVILHPFYKQSIQIMKFNRCHLERSPLESEDDTRKQCNLFSCLDLFTQPEILDSGNEWYCNRCKKHQNAKKTLEIYKTPKILIIHLKRFQQGHVVNIGSHLYTNGYSKITQFVDFPLRGLDLKNYILDRSAGSNTIYDLFAVSNHYGNMSGGHYTAVAQNPINKKWYDYNDSVVQETSEDQVVSGAAYCLFYRLRQ